MNCYFQEEVKQIMLIFSFLLWQLQETFVSFIVYKAIDLCQTMEWHS